jgi:hypothetical protein
LLCIVRLPSCLRVGVNPSITFGSHRKTKKYVSRLKLNQVESGTSLSVDLKKTIAIHGRRAHVGGDT